MNKNEAKLVKALRSGKYKQCEHQLHNPDDNSYCCLGVACKISRLGKFEGNVFFVKTDRDKATTVLPTKVRQWLGWNSNQGTAYVDTDVRNQNLWLSQLNDQGFTFDQIADFIEAGLIKHEGE